MADAAARELRECTSGKYCSVEGKCTDTAPVTAPANATVFVEMTTAPVTAPVTDPVTAPVTTFLEMILKTFGLN